jgi:hypothetical protein
MINCGATGPWDENPRMADIPVAKKFEILSEITRAQHFAWHAAVRKVCPAVDAMQVTLEMWRFTGRQTGGAYLRRMQRHLPIAPQIAESICWSSQCMGEDAVVEPGANDHEAFVVHRACPWQRWHRERDLVREDRPGCDEWFRSTIETVNEALGANVRFETLESLPEGGATCRRRIWG